MRNRDDHPPSRWTAIGLEDTRQISRIRVNPKNPDIVYVAAQGHVWGPNQQRGVFRSKDGGKTWEKVLYRNDKAGACDLISLKDTVAGTHARRLFNQALGTSTR